MSYNSWLIASFQFASSFQSIERLASKLTLSSVYMTLSQVSGVNAVTDVNDEYAVDSNFLCRSIVRSYAAQHSDVEGREAELRRKGVNVANQQLSKCLNTLHFCASSHSRANLKQTLA